MKFVRLIGPEWPGDGWVGGLARAAAQIGVRVERIHYRPGFVDTLGRARVQAHRKVGGAFVGQLAGHAARLAKDRLKEWTNWQIRQVVRSGVADLTIVLKGETLTAHTLAAVRRRSRRMVSWWLDDPARFPDAVSLLHCFDHVFVFDRACCADLSVLGLSQVSYLPCAFDPFVMYAAVSNPMYQPRHTAVFVGNYQQGRERLLDNLNDFDFRLWGAGWDAVPNLSCFHRTTWLRTTLEPAAAGDEYRHAAICPNLHHAQSRDGGLNARVFEIAGAGGFQLVDRVAGLEQHFELGKDLQTFDALEEIPDLCRYYLARPEQRFEMARSAQVRAVASHTYLARLQRMMTS